MFPYLQKATIAEIERKPYQPQGLYGFIVSILSLFGRGAVYFADYLRFKTTTFTELAGTIISKPSSGTSISLETGAIFSASLILIFGR